MNESMSEKEPIEDKELSTDEIQNLLGDENESQGEDTELDSRGTKDSKSTSESEDEEEKAKEIKLVEDTEEQEEEKEEEELDELIVPVRKKEIVAKYPTLFKEFPHLEKALYRDKAFTEIFPTPEYAKEAQEKAEALDRFEHDVTSGNTETILKSVKESNPEAFDRIVDNYLETLGNVDKEAQALIVSNVAKGLIRHVALHAKKKGKEGEPLLEAVAAVNQFLFDSDELVPPVTRSKEKDPEAERLKSEREEIFRERFTDARDGLNHKINSVLTATIDANIDTKNSMTPYMKRNATKDTLEKLHEVIQNDAAFQKVKDKLWEQAAKEKFSRNSVDRIRSAYLTKAKMYLPQVIQKVRNEALRGLTRTRKEDKDRKGPMNAGRFAGNKSEKSTKEVPKNMNTLDYLMSD